jgi:hypothetical protein
MAMLRARLAAMRVATGAIRPALVDFYQVLDHGPKVRFAGYEFRRHPRAGRTRLGADFSALDRMHST